MIRGDFVRRLVLNEIADDYENIDQVVLRGVATVGANLGWAIERSEVVATLGSLIEDGLAKAYILSGRKPYATEIEGVPSLEVVEKDFKTYFYITKKGMDLHLSDDTWWPFDDDGNLRNESRLAWHDGDAALQRHGYEDYKEKRVSGAFTVPQSVE